MPSFFKNEIDGEIGVYSTDDDNSTDQRVHITASSVSSDIAPVLLHTFS